MPPVVAIVLALIALILIFSLVWAWQLKTENAGMVDPAWAYSLGGVALLYAALGTGDPLSRRLSALFGLLWGVRLGTHLWRRNYRQPEDMRYRRFREEWGTAANHRMFWFFQSTAVERKMLRHPAPGSISCGSIWLPSVVGTAVYSEAICSVATHSTRCAFLSYSP